jgi:hypothetical protein
VSPWTRPATYSHRVGRPSHLQTLRGHDYHSGRAAMRILALICLQLRRRPLPRRAPRGATLRADIRRLSRYLHVGVLSLLLLCAPLFSWVGGLS